MRRKMKADPLMSITPTLFDLFDLEEFLPTESPAPLPKQEKASLEKKEKPKDIMGNFRKWDKKPMEDWGTAMSADAKSYVRAFKNYLKREFPDAEIIGFKPNHYDTSGFIKMNNLCVYVSHYMDRRPDGTVMVDFSDSSFRNHVLYRSARDEKDYTGGHNNWTSINKMADDIRALFEKMANNRQTNSKPNMEKEVPLESQTAAA